MKRVLHIITETSVGGAGTFVQKLAAEFKDNEEINFIVALPKNSDLKTGFKALGIEVYELSIAAHSSFNIRSILILEKFIEKVKPDIVHTHGSFSGRIAARLKEIKCIFTKYTLSYAPSKLFAFVKTINNAFCDIAIAVSMAGVKNLAESGIVEKKIRLVYKGVPKPEEFTNEQLQAERERLGIAKTDFVFTVVAQLSREKNHKIFLEAAKYVAGKYENVKFLIVGGGHLFPNLRVAANQLKIADKCIFTGQVDSVDIYLALSNAVVLASRSGNLPLPICEGFAAKKCVVATNIGGISEIVSDGFNGLLTEPDNAGNLAGAMKKLLSDTELYETLCNNAYKTWRDSFTIEKCALAMQEIYNEEEPKEDIHGKYTEADI